MKAVLGRNYIKIKTFLLEKGIIETNNKYWFSQNKNVKGECRGYRIADKFTKGKWYARKTEFRFQWDKKPTDTSQTIEQIKKDLFYIDINEEEALKTANNLYSEKKINDESRETIKQSILFIKSNYNECMEDKKTGKEVEYLIAKEEDILAIIE